MTTPSHLRKLGFIISQSLGYKRTVSIRVPAFRGRWHEVYVLEEDRDGGLRLAYVGRGGFHTRAIVIQARGFGPVRMRRLLTKRFPELCPHKDEPGGRFYFNAVVEAFDLARRRYLGRK